MISSHETATFHPTRFCETLLFVGCNVHLVTETIPSLLLHDDKGQYENVGVESAGRVDAETRFELALEYAPGDVRRTVLVYGFDAPGADVKELGSAFGDSRLRFANERHT